MITLVCPKHKKYKATKYPTAPCWYCRELFAIRVGFKRDFENYGMSATNLRVATSREQILLHGELDNPRIGG